jgi:hypothetical protein
MRIRPVIGSIALAAMAAVGCFNPPPPPPPAKLEKNQLALPLPYDLAWEAVNAVIIKNNYRVSARDPNNGIVETQVDHGEFTLKDADCGQIKGIWKFSAEPAEVASAVYNFYVKPTGIRTSLVTLTATFSAPVRVPFRPMQSVQCTSRGVQEARLLKELAEQAAITRRATYESPEQAAQEAGKGPAASSSPAAVSASESIRRHPGSDLPAQPRGFGSTGGPHLLDMPGLPSFPQAAPPLGPKAAPKAAPTP